MQNIVRLVAMEIDNIKNVRHGRLDFAKGRGFMGRMAPGKR